MVCGAEPSFTGSCSVTGTETFTPALGLIARPTRADVASVGYCTGTVIGADGISRHVTRAAAGYRQSTTGNSGSCVGALLRGSGRLTVAGADLPFTVTEPQLAAVAALRLVGSGWTGLGTAALDPRADVAGTALSCLGTGVGRIPIVLNLTATR